MVVKSSRSATNLASQGRPREEPLRVTVHYRNLAGSCGSSCLRDGGLLSSTGSAGRWGSTSQHSGQVAGSFISDAAGRPGARRVRFDLRDGLDGHDADGGGGVGAGPGGWSPWSGGRQSASMRQPGQQTARSPWSAASAAGSGPAGRPVPTARHHHHQGGGSAAVLTAARDGDHHALLELLRKNPPPSALNHRDAQGRTPASHLAAGAGGTGMLELLLQSPGVDVNQPDSEGNTPLHLAAQAGQLECVAALLRQPDVQVDARNAQGFTPLMKAALQGRTKCARALLLAGASPTLRDSGRGLRAEQWARFCGRHVCAELIERMARQRLLDRGTAYGRWGSEPELQAALGRVQQARNAAATTAATTTAPRSIKSRVRRAFRSGTAASDLPAAPSLAAVPSPAFSLVTQLTGAGLCASTPALPVPAMPPVVKSLLRPLSVPRLQVTLVGETPPPLPPRDAVPPRGPPPPPPPSAVRPAAVRAK